VRSRLRDAADGRTATGAGRHGSAPADAPGGDKLAVVDRARDDAVVATLWDTNVDADDHGTANHDGPHADDGRDDLYASATTPTVHRGHDRTADDGADDDDSAVRLTSSRRDRRDILHERVGRAIRSSRGRPSPRTTDRDA
jgi:hypothetical protein